MTFNTALAAYAAGMGMTIIATLIGGEPSWLLRVSWGGMLLATAALGTHIALNWKDDE